MVVPIQRERMSDEGGDETAEDTNVVDAITSRVDRTRGSVGDAFEDMSHGTSQVLNDAVTTVSETAASAGEVVSNMSGRAAESAAIVLGVVNDYVAENDIEVELKKHKIRIEGDAEGLKKIEAELREIERLQKSDVSVQYDRDEGINIDLGSSSK